MNTSRRSFLQASALASLAAAQNLVPASAAVPDDTASTKAELDAFAIAREHTMRRDIPGPAFLEGMLLGNGDVGVCAVVRPDGLGLHIGKNDCWDIRVSEDIQDNVLPFSDVLDLWRRSRVILTCSTWRRTSTSFAITRRKSKARIETNGRAHGHVAQYGSTGIRAGSNRFNTGWIHPMDSSRSTSSARPLRTRLEPFRWSHL